MSYAASEYADGYDAGACGYVAAVGAGLGDNSSPVPSPVPVPVPVPSLVVAKKTEQTEVPAHAQSPRGTDVVTHCLTAVEGPHHVPDRALTSGVHLS